MEAPHSIVILSPLTISCGPLIANPLDTSKVIII